MGQAIRRLLLPIKRSLAGKFKQPSNRHEKNFFARHETLNGCLKEFAISYFAPNVPELFEEAPISVSCRVVNVVLTK